MRNHKFPKLGLGTVQFGLDYGISNRDGKTNSSEVARILATAFQNGISVIDTASAYGNAEEILGENNLKNFKIVTKFVPPKDKKTIQNQLNASLSNLNKDAIYAYLAHRPNDVLQNLQQWEELKELRAKGLTKKIGFSLNSLQVLEELLSKDLIPDIIQVPYNYFDRRFESLMQNLNNQGCEIHTRSTFLQGLFFMKPSELPSYFDKIKPHLIDLQSKKLLASSLLKFSMSKKFIDKVIIGIENENQLLQNLSNIEQAEELENKYYSISENILMPSNWPK